MYSAQQSVDNASQSIVNCAATFIDKNTTASEISHSMVDDIILGSGKYLHKHFINFNVLYFMKSFKQ